MKCEEKSLEKHQIADGLYEMMKRFNSLETPSKRHVKIILRDEKDNVFTKMMEASREQNRFEEHQKTLRLKREEFVIKKTEPKENILNQKHSDNVDQTVVIGDEVSEELKTDVKQNSDLLSVPDAVSAFEKT